MIADLPAVSQLLSPLGGTVPANSRLRVTSTRFFPNPSGPPAGYIWNVSRLIIPYSVNVIVPPGTQVPEITLVHSLFLNGQLLHNEQKLLPMVPYVAVSGDTEGYANDTLTCNEPHQWEGGFYALTVDVDNPVSFDLTDLVFGLGLFIKSATTNTIGGQMIYTP